MPWSSEFIEALLPITGGGVRAPRYLLESEQVPEGVPAFGGTLMLSSFPVDGYKALIAAQGHSVSYGELNLRQWTTSRGQLSVALIWTADANDIRPYTARGQIVTLRV